MSRVLGWINNATSINSEPEPQVQHYPLDIVFADELSETFIPPNEIVEDVITADAGSILYGDSNSGNIPCYRYGVLYSPGSHVAR